MDSKQVLLVNTNTARPPIAPLGLDYLADDLRQAGFEPTLLDLAWQPDPHQAAADALAGAAPLAVGLTIRNTDTCFLLAPQPYLRQFRDLVMCIRRHSDAPIVAGGCGFSIFGQPLCRYLDVDYGIQGDGEKAFAALLQVIDRDGRQPPEEAAAGIDGVITRASESSSKLSQAPPRGSSPRNFVDNRRYFQLGGQMGFETKRGCNQACIYCADPVAKGRALHLREPTAVADELEALLDQDIDVLHTCDAEFNAPPEHAEAICRELIGRGLGSRLRWYAYCQVSGFSDELCMLMRRAGCVGINFGVDAVCDTMLRRLGRSYRAADVSPVVTACRREGIAVMLDLLLGGPGETPETLAETIGAVKRIDPDCAGAALGVRVYPNTPLATLVRQQGRMASNPNLLGQKDDNETLLEPVFYVEHALGPQPHRTVYETIAGDARFFVADPDQVEANYDYSENQRLCEAIAGGARGAYWDILRSLHD
ncbi:MAG TPA: radical SAM protein [Phycisphaerae bacterium]|nr:radical SAM protein [Phycisphaerae bacterium]